MDDIIANEFEAAMDVLELVCGHLHLIVDGLYDFGRLLLEAIGLNEVELVGDISNDELGLIEELG